MDATSVEASKAIRLQRLEARKRNRGGIFVPATSNPLIDILLARDVSGASPRRQQKLHKSSRKKDVSTTSRAKSAPRKAGKTKLDLKVSHDNKSAERIASKSTKKSEERVEHSSHPQADQGKLSSKKKKSARGTNDDDNARASKSISKKSEAIRSRAIIEEVDGEELNDGPQEPGSSKQSEIRQRSKKRMREGPEEEDEADLMPNPPSKKRAKKATITTKADCDPLELPAGGTSSKTKETSQKPRRKGRTKDPPLSKSVVIDITMDQVQVPATTAIDTEDINNSRERKKTNSRSKARTEEKPVLLESLPGQVLGRHENVGRNDAKDSSNRKETSHTSLSESNRKGQPDKSKKKVTRPSSKDKKENVDKTSYTHTLDSVKLPEKGSLRSKHHTKIPISAFDTAMDSDSDPIDFLTKH